MSDNERILSDLSEQVLAESEDSALLISLQRVEPFLDAIQLRYSQMWKEARQNFALEILRPNTCWPWPGFRDKQGYGLKIVDGEFFHIHRLAFEFYKGERDRSKVVMHSCDNPPCFNPDHLFEGSQRENMEDMIRKGRGRWQTPTFTTVVGRLTHQKRDKVVARLTRQGNDWTE